MNSPPTKIEWSPVKPECTFMNAYGTESANFKCYLPWIGATYTPFERDYNPRPVLDWMIDHPALPMIAVSLYGIWCVCGQRYFAKREPLDWRKTMACWNLGLSVFSAIGFCRVAPHLFYNFYHYSLYENFCFDPENSYGSESTGLWIQLFILSKFPELFDTFFIVIHKKPLILLHWYHHITVLLYCWHSYVTKSPPGIIFCTMNYAVHSIMYGYYYLMAIKCKPKWFQPVWITIAQISQMMVGVAVTIFGCFVLWGVKTPIENCTLTKDNNIAGLLMYGSYLVLFLQFFWKRYFGKSTKKTTMTSNKATKKIQ